ncbi:MAG TPA: hypothetical protein VMN39_05815, partial [Longimicrobiaceae bacterium]|nr:hypothetical protein [Longimicrobiaceae bacterium]
NRDMEEGKVTPLVEAVQRLRRRTDLEPCPTPCCSRPARKGTSRRSTTPSSRRPADWLLGRLLEAGERLVENPERGTRPRELRFPEREPGSEASCSGRVSRRAWYRFAGPSRSSRRR